MTILRRSKWSAWLGAVLLFSSGLVIGALGLALVLKHQVQAFVDGRSMLLRDLAVQGLAYEFDLDKEQRKGFVRLIDQGRTRLQIAKVNFQPEIDNAVFGLIEEFSGTLSPNQRERMRDTLYMRLTQGRGRVISRLYRSLKLEFSQVPQVSRILADTNRRTAPIGDLEQLNARLIRSSSTELSKLLTEQQRTEFNKFLQELAAEYPEPQRL